MKITYLAEYVAATSIGVEKKINSQIKVFKQSGFDVEFINLVYSAKNSIIKKISRRVNIFYPISYDGDFTEFNIKSEILYIRYRHFDYPFFRFLKKFRNKGGKLIIIEMPTYPFSKEIKGILSKLILVKSYFFSLFINKYIDFIVTYSDHDRIYKIPTIKITNGIDVSAIKVKQKLELKDCVNIIAVAHVSVWHGYDRVIRGIKEYYSKNAGDILDVTFHIVGDGPELIKLKRLAADLKLSDRVVFHGIKSGLELDKLFNEAHVAIGSLGCHRINIFSVSTLKTREYCSRGIPFVNAPTVSDISSDFKYLLYVEQNDNPIDINSVIEFKTFI
jgi:hypothetical protein